MKKILAKLLVAALALGVALPAAAQEPFYAGKRVNMLVPFAAGGGTDVWARFIAEYLRKHVEGSPVFIIDNRAGGGGVSGANYFEANTPADGLTVLASSGSTIQPYLLGAEIVRFDLGNWIPLTVNPVGAIFYANPASGIETLDDLLTTDIELLYGGISASGNDLVMLLIFDLLGIEARSVWGFDGKGTIRVAYERGELNTDYQVTPAYTTNVQPLVDEGKAVPLFTFGIIGADGDVVTDPAFPELPTVKDVYRSIHGEDPSGIEWEAYKTFLAAGFGVQKILWVKQGTPPEAIEALEAGLAATASDEEFLSEGAEIIGGYPLMTGEEAVAAAATITNASDEVVEYGKAFLHERGLF